MMNDAPDGPGVPDDGPELLKLIRTAMESYEDAFGRGERPRIEQLVAGLTGTVRDRVVLELLSQEVELLRRAGESPRPGDYQARFPEPPGLIHEAFDQAEATRSVPRDSLAEGWLGKYEIRWTLGEGGQASTYLARDTALHRFVVLKVFWDHDRPGQLERIYAEARILVRLQSDYVAKCYSVEEAGGRVFLVLEYVAGRDLQQVGKQEDPWKAARLVERIAEGMATIHDADLIHADLKPANIILGEDGRPRIIDFGLSVPAGSGPTGVVGGSPKYLAPEQVDDTRGRIGRRTDVFGLGGVLYFLLTGRAPFEADTAGGALELARKAEIFPPRQLNRKVPAPIDAVCRKCLAADPEGRYGTAREVAAALKRARRRWRAHAALVLGILALATVAVLGFNRLNRGPAGPLEAELRVVHYKELGDGKRIRSHGEMDARTLLADPIVRGDLVRVQASLSRPGYSYLIALNPDGKDQLCLPSPPAGSPVGRLDFPEDPAEFFGLTDGAGLQAFVLVTSDGPLPAYEAWKAEIPGGIGWSPTDLEGLWTYASDAPADASRVRGTFRGQILKREAAPEGLVDVCDRLRKMPGVTKVQAVAFPVIPPEEIKR